MTLHVADLDDLLCIDGQSVALLGHRAVQLSELPTVLLEHRGDWSDVESALTVVLTALGDPGPEIDTRRTVAEVIRDLVALGLVVES